MKKNYYIAFLLLTYLFSSTLLSASPSEIYKETSESGQVIYTSKPYSNNSVKAKLPEIIRKTGSVKSKELATCVNHGGVNCQAGEDTDGSVICFDGFKDASSRYRFSCSKAKLSIVTYEPKEDRYISIIVRNTLSVDAKEPYLYYRKKRGAQVKITGPNIIPAFAAEEFKFNHKELNIDPNTIKKSDFMVNCRNCN
jgi:hypothetical protein